MVRIFFAEERASKLPIQRSPPPRKDERNEAQAFCQTPLRAGLGVPVYFRLSCLFAGFPILGVGNSGVLGGFPWSMIELQRSTAKSHSSTGESPCSLAKFLCSTGGLPGSADGLPRSMSAFLGCTGFLLRSRRRSPRSTAESQPCTRKFPPCTIGLPRSTTLLPCSTRIFPWSPTFFLPWTAGLLPRSGILPERRLGAGGRLLAAEVGDVGEEAGDGVGFGGVVVAADLAGPIDQDHPGAVHRLAVVRGEGGELEAVAGEPVDGRFVAGEEFPAPRLGVQFLGVIAEDARRVVLGVDAERNQFDVGVAERLLGFAHPAADHGAGAGAGGVDEVGDPDFPLKLLGAERLPGLIGEGEGRNRPELRQLVAPEPGDLGLAEEEKAGRDEQGDEKEGDFPGERARGEGRAGRSEGGGRVHGLVSISAASRSGR